MPEASKNGFCPAVPVLRVQDVEGSVAYYRDALGFEVRWNWRRLCLRGAATVLSVPHQ